MLREKMLMPLVYGTDAAQESSTVGLMLCGKMCRVGGLSSMVSWNPSIAIAWYYGF